MKKLFFAICFNLLITFPVGAKVTPISGYGDLPKKQEVKNSQPEVKEVNYNDFKNFVSEQFKKGMKADPDNINHNVGYVPSLMQRQKEKDSKKSFFQKVYDEALGRVGRPTTVSRTDVAKPQFLEQPKVEEQKEKWQNTSFPMITAYLPPNNQATPIPALEHIPYLMNSIEVLPNGLVKFEETVVVVANGNKLNSGLTKILPLKIYDFTGKSQQLDYSVLNVMVNDMPVEYHFASDGFNALLVPDSDYKLTPGIYTYKFEYVVDNLLWQYNDTYMFYWDIGGNGWNLVVDRLGASLSLPKEGALLDDNVFIGSIMGLKDGAVSTYPNGRFAKAYVANQPLFIGEGMHLVAYIAADALQPPSLWQKIIRSFYSYGDIYLALFGFLIICLSFTLSWYYIRKGKGRMKISLSKTAMVIRYLLQDKFDMRSIGGFLLELYKKNIIDIQQAGDTILLIKRTDNLKNLPKFEQKALHQLFPSHETTFSVSHQNLLPFKRFVAKLEGGLLRQMFKFRIKLNIGYLLFSLAMLFLTELFIALFKINSAYTFGVASSATLICLAAILMWRCKKRWVKLIARFISLDIIAACLVVLSAVIHPIAVMFLIASVVVIVYVLGVYSRRRGLIRSYIQDINDFRDYLIKHHDNIVLSKDFVNYQSAIWAFELEKEFVPSGNPEYNKLPIIGNIMEIFNKKR